MSENTTTQTGEETREDRLLAMIAHHHQSYRMHDHAAQHHLSAALNPCDGDHVCEEDHGDEESCDCDLTCECPDAETSRFAAETATSLAHSAALMANSVARVLAKVIGS